MLVGDECTIFLEGERTRVSEVRFVVYVVKVRWIYPCKIDRGKKGLDERKQPSNSSKE